MITLRFSVVITFYNQRSFVQTAVESALSQKHPLAEIIVVDDGSTDGSQELLRRYADSIRLETFPVNRGAIVARNHGASLARGQYLIFLDGDDALMPRALAVYDRLIAARRPSIILGERVWFEGAEPPPGRETTTCRIEFIEYPHMMEKDRPYGTCASSLVVAREAYLAVGGWSVGIFHMDTVDYVTKLGYSGPTILICSPPTVFYRLHAANSVRTVPPFLKMGHVILAKERAGKYPGGAAQRYQRYAWLGGIMFFWVRRALKAGLYKDATELGFSASPMIVAAAIRRAAVRIKRRRPIEILDANYSVDTPADILR
jgi:glycosyltransferase involved in cell wall biosynthesis